jgi:hypothetical protein
LVLLSGPRRGLARPVRVCGLTESLGLSNELVKVSGCLDLAQCFE